MQTTMKTHTRRRGVVMQNGSSEVTAIPLMGDFSNKLISGSHRISLLSEGRQWELESKSSESSESKLDIDI